MVELLNESQQNIVLGLKGHPLGHPVLFLDPLLCANKNIIFERPIFPTEGVRLSLSLSDNETTESACIKITDFMTTQAVVFEPKEQVRIIVGYGVFILLGFIANLVRYGLGVHVHSIISVRLLFPECHLGYNATFEGANCEESIHH